MKTYLAGISAAHKLSGLKDPTASFLVKKLLKGLSNLVPQKDSRLPITFDRLKNIIARVPVVTKNADEARLFKAAFSLTFFGFFRISEVLGQGTGAGRDALRFDDVSFCFPCIQIRLHGSKTDQRGLGHVITLSHVNTAKEVCPILLLNDYMHRRSQRSGALLTHWDGTPLSKYQFDAVLKNAIKSLGWPTHGYSSHSFRIGAATTAAFNGLPTQSIMHLGRWKSRAVRKYIRKDPMARNQL